MTKNKGSLQRSMYRLRQHWLNWCERSFGRMTAGLVCGFIWLIGSSMLLPPMAVTGVFMIACIIAFTETVIYHANFRDYPLTGPNRVHKVFWRGFLYRCSASWFVVLVFKVWSLPLIAFLAFLLLQAVRRNPPATVVLEGNEVDETASQAHRHFDRQRPATDPGLLFGGVPIPTSSATKNFLMVGTVGAGKSVTMKLLMKDVLANIGGELDQRAIIYDPAKEISAMLEAMGFGSRNTIHTNPFDQRCRPWHIAKDIQTPTDAQTLAEILVPERKGSKDEFWRNVTLITIKVAVRYFAKSAPDKWTLRDVLHAARSLTLIDQMIADDLQLKHYTGYKGSENTAANIQSSVLTYLEPYENIAALWHKAETVYGNQPFSIDEFLNSSAVLILGRNESAKQALQSVNRVLLTRLAQRINGGEQRKYPAIWFFLDEIASLGHLPALMTAITELRKYGGGFVAGLQSITQIREKYGQEESNSILSQFNHKAALRLADAETEKWLVALAGKLRLMRHTQSVSHNWQSGDSTTFSQNFAEQDTIRPGTFMDIPEFAPAEGVGLQGMYLSGNQKWWHTYPPEIVKKLPPSGDEKRNLLEMPKEFQWLEPWAAADYERLGIAHLMQEPAINIRDILDQRDR